MAVDVTEGPTFSASIPSTLSQVPLAQINHSVGDVQAFSWDVAPDGKRFLIEHTATTSSEPITVSLNWTADLKKK